MIQIQRTDGTNFTPSKILAVGLNYAQHIEEMRSKRTAEPVIFLKPNSALASLQEPVRIPTQYGAVHHEIELCVLITKEAFQISEQEATHSIGGYGLALDLTLRDIQKKAKERGHPWAIAKGFKGACPVSPFVPADQVADSQNLELTLKVNGQVRQNGNTRQMLFRIPELIAYVSRFFPLEPGDLLLTGTPSGVGPLLPGDSIEARIESVAEIKTECVSW